MAEVKKPHLPSAPASESFKQQARAAFESLRDKLCRRLEQFESSARFEQTPWKRAAEPKRPDQGGGVMSILCGDVFEKAGVHTSTVYGQFSEEFRDRIPGCEDSPDFWASGVSLIVHPRSPRIPTAHMNLRMIATGRSWLGGGADLTPMLERQRNNETEDAIAFHGALRGACDKHNPDYYARFQEWCDTYFFLPHRNEARGIGGIFYDYLDSGKREADLAFAEDVGAAFLQVYPQIVEAHVDEKWSEEERLEQLHRRGRYVEFNLLYDRGTIFGLRTGGNVEAILSSLPPLASWS
ncbi:MAG: oxygen-dependent coproporphyrinogen oxidase [Hyphomicrobiales bacterium]|nr:oxygen-dependent coproporphyrinogen oxidase [Hyphomicrobiales bacterium]